MQNIALDVTAFWSRFENLLADKMRTEGYRTKKEFFKAHNIAYSSYDNAKRLGRIPATEAVVSYASLFGVSVDWILLGDDRSRLTPAQLVVSDNPDIERIVLTLGARPELLGFIRAGLGL